MTNIIGIEGCCPGMKTMDSDTTQIFVRGDNNLIHDYDHVKFCPFRSKKISIIEG
jgi:hypothetical protein